MTPPQDSGGGRGDGAADLTALRERARAGVISIDEYLGECLKFAGRHARRNSRPYLDKDAFDADDIAQEAIANAVRAYGQLIDRGVTTGNPVGNVNSVLRTIVMHVLADHNPAIRDEASPAGGVRGPRPDAEVRKRPVSFDVLWHEGGSGDLDAGTSQSSGYAAEATLAEAREQARRRLHVLAAQARKPQACPFNMTSEDGCPHAGQIFELLGSLIDQDLESAGPGALERLRELGRQLGLSSKDNEFRRQLAGCFHWWSYQVFAGTAVDQPGAGGDRIRMPLVGWLVAGLKAGGRWDSSACPLRGARKILATKPGEFQRLLARVGRSDVYEFLTRRAS